LSFITEGLAGNRDPTREYVGERGGEGFGRKRNLKKKYFA